MTVSVPENHFISHMMYSDRIVTERLILRRMTEKDAKDVLALMSDDYTARMAGFRPISSIEEAIAFIDRWKGEYSFAVTERSDDRVIGIIQTEVLMGLGYFDLRTDFVELGYLLSAEHRGKGYMTEVIGALKEFFFEHYEKVGELQAHIFCGNEASRRVVLKCGFRPMYEEYRENVYSPYGTVESKETFSILKEDYEWEKRGVPFYSTAERKAAA